MNNNNNSPVLTNIGIIMPAGFPIIHYENILSKMKKHSEKDNYRHFACSWNAVAARFKSCIEYKEEFANSIKRASPTPYPPERYIQDRALFGFFVSGLSSIESLFYGLYMICSFQKQKEFPTKPEKNLRNIFPKNTTELFRKNFPESPLGDKLDGIIISNDYKAWCKIRNILAHREVSGRNLFNNNDEVLWQVDGAPINDKMLCPRVELLRKILNILLKGIDDFTSK